MRGPEILPAAAPARARARVRRRRRRGGDAAPILAVLPWTGRGSSSASRSLAGWLARLPPLRLALIEKTEEWIDGFVLC